MGSGWGEDEDGDGMAMGWRWDGDAMEMGWRCDGDGFQKNLMKLIYIFLKIDTLLDKCVTKSKLFLAGRNFVCFDPFETSEDTFQYFGGCIYGGFKNCI